MVDTKEARERIKYCRACPGSKTSIQEAVMWGLRLADEVDALRTAANFERAECGAATGTPSQHPVLTIDAITRRVTKIETPPGYRFKRPDGAALSIGERVEEGDQIAFHGAGSLPMLAGTVVVEGKVA